MFKLTTTGFLLLISLFTLFTGIAFGQSEDVLDKTSKIEFTDLPLEKSSDVVIISAFKTDDGYVILKKEPIRGPGGWNYFLQRFDNNMKPVNLMDISDQFENDDYIIGGIIRVKKSYILISTKVMTDEHVVNLYAQRLEWENNKLEKPIEIYSEPYERKPNQIQYTLSASKGNEYMLIVVNPPYKKDEKEKFFFKVYDEKLNEVLSKEKVEFEETDYAYSLKQFVLGAKGELYILGSKFTPADRKLGIKTGPTKYEITTLTNDERDVIPIDLGDKIVADIALYINDKNELYVSGYYRKEEGIGIDGVFLFTVNPKTGDISNSISDEFSQEFITEGWSDRQVKKAEKQEDKGRDLGLSNLEFRDIIRHNDGSMSIVGEVFYVTYVTTTNSNGTTSTRTVYHYADLVVTRVSVDGEILNHTRYDKHHTYSGGYIYFNQGNDLVIMRNGSRLSTFDPAEREEMSKIDEKKLGGEALLISRITPDGKMTTKCVIDYKNSDYYRAKRYKIIRNDATIIRYNKQTEVLLLTYLGRSKFAIGRVTFD